MNVTAPRIRALIQELIDDNPFACRALLQIVSTEFTTDVPTAAVTCGGEPRLLLNPEFLARHCQTDAHVKAVICHEFLHVLLRHTEGRGPQSWAEHLALDAVINAIIHRALGEAYSSFMTRFYQCQRGVGRLLRAPPAGKTGYWSENYRNADEAERKLLSAWSGLYAGCLVVDDIHALALDLQAHGGGTPRRGWLGDHAARAGDAQSEPLSEPVRAALERALKSMNGSGIWRAPRERGEGAEAYRAQVTAADIALERWRREAWRVLRRHLLPDRRAPRRQDEPGEFRLPVLGPGDRRAFARALWSPLLPEATWLGARRTQGASAQVYLDVSGSMNREMPLIIALLARLGSHVRRPFWAFSDVVAPAVIRDGQLHADTTGGTSMACVLRHLAETRPRAAVVVTDGYIESLTQAQVRLAAGVRMHAIVTRDGSPAALQRAGIPYTQLGRLPQ